MITEKIITKEKFELAKALIDKGTFKQLSSTRIIGVFETFSLKADKAKKFSAATVAEVTAKPMDFAPFDKQAALAFGKQAALASGFFALGLAANSIIDSKVDSISIAPTGASVVFKPIEHQTKFDYSGAEHKVQNDITEDLQVITQLQLKQKQLSITKVLYENQIATRSAVVIETQKTIQNIANRQQVQSLLNDLHYESKIDELNDLKKSYENAVDEVHEIRQSFEDKCAENKEFLNSMRNQRSNNRVWSQSRNLQARSARHSDGP